MGREMQEQQTRPPKAWLAGPLLAGPPLDCARGVPCDGGWGDPELADGPPGGRIAAICAHTRGSGVHRCCPSGRPSCRGPRVGPVPSRPSTAGCPTLRPVARGLRGHPPRGSGRVPGGRPTLPRGMHFAQLPDADRVPQVRGLLASARAKRRSLARKWTATGRRAKRRRPRDSRQQGGVRGSYIMSDAARAAAG